MLRRLSDGDDRQRIEREGEFAFEGLTVEGTDHDARQAHLRGLQEHALRGDPEIHIDIAVFRDGGAGDDEGFGLRTGERQMKFRKGAAEVDVLQYDFRGPG